MPPHTSLPPDPVLPTFLAASGPIAGSVALTGRAQDRPLQGVTLLAVEDSRFACEALRLMARRAGARLGPIRRIVSGKRVGELAGRVRTA